MLLLLRLQYGAVHVRVNARVRAVLLQQLVFAAVVRHGGAGAAGAAVAGGGGAAGAGGGSLAGFPLPLLLLPRGLFRG